MSQDRTDSYKLTYSTMFDPPASLHERFERAVAALPSREGADHPMWIGGRAVGGHSRFETRSPIDRDRVLGRFVSADGAAVARR